jgi:hypothetical protein
MLYSRITTLESRLWFFLQCNMVASRQRAIYFSALVWIISETLCCWYCNLRFICRNHAYKSIRSKKQFQRIFVFKINKARFKIKSTSSLYLQSNSASPKYLGYIILLEFLLDVEWWTTRFWCSWFILQVFSLTSEYDCEYRLTKLFSLLENS